MNSENFSDDELVMISALEHYAYCPRQCALIHLEQVFEENIFTLKGRFLHESVHETGSGIVDGIRVERALPLWSEKLGLTGKADLVEFHADGAVCPVEYKRGKKRARECIDLQLCAQAICLEEMLGVKIGKGEVYHHASRRRREVPLISRLRHKVEDTVADVRKMIKEQLLPAPVADARCRNCSLKQVCMDITEEQGLCSH